MTKEELREEVYQFYEKLDSGEDKRMTEHSAWIKTLNKTIELYNLYPEHQKLLKGKIGELIVQKHKSDMILDF